MPKTPETCRVYEDDEGQPIRVRGSEPLDDRGQAAMRELVGAAKRRFKAEREAEEAAIRADERAKVAEEILDLLADRPDDATAGRRLGDYVVKLRTAARGEQP